MSNTTQPVNQTYAAVREYRRLLEPLRQNPFAPELLAAIERFISTYAVLPDGAPLVLSLYAVMTHCFECFGAIPYLLITSPTKGCGKTRVLELLSNFSKDAILTASISAAVLYRIVRDKKPTLLMDESEKLTGHPLSDSAKAILEVSNSGYKKAAQVWRCKGNEDNYKPEAFSVFGPKVFAAIIDKAGAFPATLQDRSIEIQMAKAKHKLSFYHADLAQEAAQPYEAQLKVWVEKNRPLISEWYRANRLDFLQGRAEEIWLPLFAVCAVMAPNRMAELRAFALKQADSNAENESDFKVRLLRSIQSLFTEDRLESDELCKRLNQAADTPYGSWNDGRGIQSTQLAKFLGPFKIKPKQLKFGGVNRNGYERSAFKDAWASYFPRQAKPRL